MAGELNLEEAPPEFMQDEDLWGGFMRPEVAGTVLPPIEEFETGDRGGLMPSFDDVANRGCSCRSSGPAGRGRDTGESGGSGGGGGSARSA